MRKHIVAQLRQAEGENKAESLVLIGSGTAC
jgi:hypothetical protein